MNAELTKKLEQLLMNINNGAITLRPSQIHRLLHGEGSEEFEQYITNIIQQLSVILKNGGSGKEYPEHIVPFKLKL